ncbi:MAG: cohesin domain-containing protein, partial [Faecousia sp.]
MRKHSRRLTAVLLVVAMVFTLCLTGYAAEQTALLVLNGESAAPVLNGRVSVTVGAAVDGVVADGKLTIEYDSNRLQYLSAKLGDAWLDDTDPSLQINSTIPGKLVVAFAGEEATMVGDVIVLSFKTTHEGEAKVKINADKSYITGADGYTLAAETVLEVGGHHWSDWTQTAPATCTEDGEETRTCAHCGEVETRTIKATGHKWGTWTEEKKATCTTNGVETRTCELCKVTESRLTPEIGHSYTEETVSPTCTEVGYTLHTCSNCGE